MNEHTNTPNNIGRKTDGTFAKGNKLSPGRPPGARGKAALLAEQLIETDCEQIVSKLVALAKDGDVTAGRLLLDRLLPIKKDRPIQFQLPKIHTVSDASAAMTKIIAAVSSGELLPSEGDILCKMVESSARLTEITLLESRVAALEATNK